jgi:hypothetical protein
MTFEDGVYAAVEASGVKVTKNQRRLLRYIENHAETNAFMVGLEQATLAHLGLCPQTGFDWNLPVAVAKIDGAQLTAINWAAILAFLEALLPIILPLL